MINATRGFEFFKSCIEAVGDRYALTSELREFDCAAKRDIPALSFGIVISKFNLQVSIEQEAKRIRHKEFVLIYHDRSAKRCRSPIHFKLNRSVICMIRCKITNG